MLRAGGRRRALGLPGLSAACAALQTAGLQPCRQRAFASVDASARLQGRIPDDMAHGLPRVCGKLGSSVR
eukprot:6079630-Alexandrium_andersonii.AAC.1